MENRIYIILLLLIATVTSMFMSTYWMSPYVQSSNVVDSFRNVSQIVLSPKEDMIGTILSIFWLPIISGIVSLYGVLIFLFKSRKPFQKISLNMILFVNILAVLIFIIINHTIPLFGISGLAVLLSVVIFYMHSKKAENG